MKFLMLWKTRILSIYLSFSTIPRWFYEWWSCLGENKQVMPRQFAEKFPQFQIDEGISTLPENIKLCKVFLKKRLSYIISWTLVIADFDRIKFLF